MTRLNTEKSEAAMKTRQAGLSDRALELIMREVMDGLEELSIDTALNADHGSCTVLSIESPKRSSKRPEQFQHNAEVLDFFRYRKAVNG